MHPSTPAYPSSPTRDAPAAPATLKTLMVAEHYPFAEEIPAHSKVFYRETVMFRDPNRVGGRPATGDFPASEQLSRAGPACRYRMVLDSVRDYRIVRDYLAKTGVKSSQSGNSSH